MMWSWNQYKLLSALWASLNYIKLQKTHTHTEPGLLESFPYWPHFQVCDSLSLRVPPSPSHFLLNFIFPLFDFPFSFLYQPFQCHFVFSSSFPKVSQAVRTPTPPLFWSEFWFPWHTPTLCCASPSLPLLRRLFIICFSKYGRQCRGRSDLWPKHCQISWFWGTWEPVPEMPQIALLACSALCKCFLISEAFYVSQKHASKGHVWRLD